MWGPVAACWLRRTKKGGHFWINKTTSCPSLVFSPGSCLLVLSVSPPPKAWSSGICHKWLWTQQVHFPGILGPVSFSSIYVWGWLWLSVKLVVCAWRFRAEIRLFIFHCFDLRAYLTSHTHAFKTDFSLFKSEKKNLKTIPAELDNNLGEMCSFWELCYTHIFIIIKD